jgi:hypothetical protein
MRTIEILLAGLVLLVCAALLLRLLLPAPRRARFDAFWVRSARSLRALWQRSVTAPGRRRAAEREAREVIERVRRTPPDGGDWDGNVYRPKSFKRPKKPH